MPAAINASSELAEAHRRKYMHFCTFYCYCVTPRKQLKRPQIVLTLCMYFCTFLLLFGHYKATIETTTNGFDIVAHSGHPKFTLSQKNMHFDTKSPSLCPLPSPVAIIELPLLTAPSLLQSPLQSRQSGRVLALSPRPLPWRS